MTSRRDFIRNSTILSLSGMLPLSSAYAEQNAHIPISDYPEYQLFFDNELSQSKSFAATAQYLGLSAKAVRTDMGMQWVNEIEPALKKKPMVLAGMTLGAPLFCLEYLSREYGMKLLYRVEHSFNESGLVTHQVYGSEELNKWQTIIQDSADNWVVSATQLMYENLINPVPLTEQLLLDLANKTEALEQSVYTWMLVPELKHQI